MEIEPLKISFDLDKYKEMGLALKEEAKKYSKEAANSVVEYETKTLDLIRKMQGGLISKADARVAILRYQRATIIALAAAKEKMQWSIARKYWQAGQDLIDFIAAALGGLISAI